MASGFNLYTVLSKNFEANSSAIALQTPDRSYSFADIEKGSAQYANVLRSLKLPDGARIAVQVEKSPEALMLYLASLRAGLVYLPLNTAYTISEVEYFINDAQPGAIVCDPSKFTEVIPLAAKVNAVRVFSLDQNGKGTLDDVAKTMASTFETVACKPDDLAAILYTSGTTGPSKGAMLSHSNLAANAQVLHEYWQWTGKDVLLHMLPIFHVHGLFVAAQGALLAGARMIWLNKFDIDQALKYLPHSTLFMGVPTYYVRLLSNPAFTRELCANIRVFISGSAPLLEDTFNKFEQRTGQRILERYGMSETNMLASNPYAESEGQRIAGTVGKPLPTVEIRIVDDTDNELQVGEVGHVQVRGPNVFSGYWRMPKKTEEEFTTDGWFRTGDLGCKGGNQVPDDYVAIVGRNSDMIISGGFNVYPKEIELLLDEQPGVLESAVIGMSHPDFGEAVVAVVVPQEGASISTDQILSNLKNKLANFKIPKQIHIVNTLPRNTMGKVQKNILRKQYG